MGNFSPFPSFLVNKIFLSAGNAIAGAQTPTMDRLSAGNMVEIEAHGSHVGLPDSLMGNSEVGHLNIGTGRVIYQVRFRWFLIIRPQNLSAASLKAANHSQSPRWCMKFLISNDLFVYICTRVIWMSPSPDSSVLDNNHHRKTK